jgi:hypothetical protein
MAKERSNIQELDNLLKLANNLNSNSTSELEIEWYMKIKRMEAFNKLKKLCITASRSFQKFYSLLNLYMT